MAFNTFPGPWDRFQTETDQNYGFGNYQLVNTNELAPVLEGIRADTRANWEREDSAYQRMVADMRKAGLNPWTGISTGGLSTSNQSPTSDAFSALLSSLSLNNDAVSKKDKNERWTVNTVVDGLLKAFKIFTLGML